MYQHLQERACWLFHKDLEALNRALFFYKQHGDQSQLKAWQPLAKSANPLSPSLDFLAFDPAGKEDLLKIRALLTAFPDQLEKLSTQIQVWDFSRRETTPELNREVAGLEQGYERISQLTGKLRILLQQEAWRSSAVLSTDPFLPASAKACLLASTASRYISLT